MKKSDVKDIVTKENMRLKDDKGYTDVMESLMKNCKL